MNSLIVNVNGSGKANPMMEFDAFDMAHLVLYAERVRCVKDALKVASRKYDSTQSEFELDFIGAMGEYAVCKYFDIPMNREIYIGGDNGVDIDIHGSTCQIKTINPKWNDPDLYFNDESCFSTDVAICTKIISPVKVEIIGCISKRKFMTICFPTNYGHGPRIAVKARKALSHVDVLLPNQGDDQFELALGVDNEAYVA